LKVDTAVRFTTRPDMNREMEGSFTREQNFWIDVLCRQRMTMIMVDNGGD